MSHAAKILADSLSPDGVRLTSMEVTFPRPILSEFNTHRMFSRNSASSRAIPVEKMIKMVMEDPYIPTHWGKNQKGMQAEQEVSELDALKARDAWVYASRDAIRCAEDLREIGIHKQITNRLLEPFMWHTCIVTATEWDNFFHLRDNKDAHPEIQKIAHMMRELHEASVPRKLDYGGWHTPLISDEEDEYTFCDSDPAALPVADKLKVSVARCARVSYLTHDGKRDIQADLDLHDRLLQSGHLSPFEHVARPMTQKELERYHRWEPEFSVSQDPASGHIVTVPSANAFRDTYFHGNYNGWIQNRKLIPNEADILGKGI